MSTRLVATVLVTDIASVADTLKHPMDGADYIELRLDALLEPSPKTVQAILDLPRSAPVIATCRTAEQGGLFTDTDSKRIALLTAAAEAGADIVDIEDSSLADLPDGLPGERIASCHLSRFVPRLDALAGRLVGRGTAFSKLCVPADTPKQLTALMEIQDTFRDHLAVVPTGRLAEAGRVMAAARGSPLTYGAVSADAPGHPDQPTAERLYHVHNVTSLPPDTHFYGVVGRPVAHSMSPIYHNTVFRGVAQSARLVPMDIDSLEGVMKFADKLRLEGFAVTHPFKQEAIEVAHSVLPGARGTSAGNTLVHTPAGWQTRNTDWKAACDLFPRLLDAWLKGRRANASPSNWINDVIAGCWRPGGGSRTKRTPEDPVPKVLLLGAGGAARALAVALFDESVELAVWSRRLSHARDLAARLADSIPAVAIPEPSHIPADVVVNATPVGMPGIDPGELSTFGPSNFREGAVALDLTYGHAQSPFREAAREAGVPLLTGEFFFGLQARRQAEVFTGATIPTELRKQAAIQCGAVVE
jgi:3-dehydroquinate dehydratase/shikimate dehydrogenase